MRRDVIVGALVVSMAPAVAQPDSNTRGVALRIHDNGAIVVPVTLDGLGPYPFLLDTGSSRSAIASSVAARHGYAPTGHARLVTPSGQAEVPLTRVETLSVHGTVATNVSPMIVSDATLARRAPVRGLLGQDVLAAFTYTIDYERRRLLWHETPEPAGYGARLPLTWDGARLLVGLVQRGGDSVRLVPDTGTATVVLFAGPHRSGLAVRPGDAGALRTLSGPRAARHALVEELHVGDVRLRDQAAVIVHEPAGADLGDGLLPLHVFGRVTISVPAGYLSVERRRR